MLEIPKTYMQWIAVIATIGFIVTVIDILSRFHNQDFEDTEFPNEEDE